MLKYYLKIKKIGSENCHEECCKALWIIQITQVSQIIQVNAPYFINTTYLKSLRNKHIKSRDCRRFFRSDSFWITPPEGQIADWCFTERHYPKEQFLKGWFLDRALSGLRLPRQGIFLIRMFLHYIVSPIGDFSDRSKFSYFCSF